MTRPFTRRQALQNQAFLRALRRTGNARAAAESLGVHRATYIKRRNAHPAFAADWDAALALAHAALERSSSHGEGKGAGAGGAASPSGAAPSEPHLVRLKSGRLQLRVKPPGRLTREAEQSFLAALSATANVRLSAKAAGFSHAAFYHRARTHAGFAREMRLALQTGYDRLDLALTAACQPSAHADDAWRHNELPPIPPMSFEQAMQLMYLHQKEARLVAEPEHLKRRRGESSDVHAFRLAEMARARLQRDRDAYALAQAIAASKDAPPVPAPSLPALDQITGWSDADPDATIWAPGRALFGGRRFR